MQWKRLLAPVLAAALLAGIGLAATARPRAADAEPFHARVRAAAADIPRQIGAWSGQDVPLPDAAQELLRPNVMLSRQYHDIATGHAATFLLVHCKDARDMLGHYPPNCYPRAGWSAAEALPKTWDLGEGLTVEGMEYHFKMRRIDGERSLVVANLILLPDGRTVRSMDDVAAAESDYTRRFFGGAQVQIVTDGRLGPERRDEIFRELIGANADLVRTLGSADVN